MHVCLVNLCNTIFWGEVIYLVHTSQGRLFLTGHQMCTNAKTVDLVAL